MRKRLLIIAAIMAAALVAFVGYVYWFHGPRALRAYHTELRTKGEKLTLEEILDTFSTNRGGCLEALSNSVSHFGPVSSDLTNVQLKAAYTELTNTSLLRFSQPGRAQVSFRQPAPPWAGSVSGRQCSTWSGSSNRLSQVTALMRDLRNAMKHPDAHGGPRTDAWHTVTPWREVREAGSWLTFAALVSLHDGRDAEALADAEALVGLANLHREEYSMVSEMTRVGAAQMGLDVTWQALQATRWNDLQLAELQHCWESVDLLEGLERAFVGERALGLDAIRRLQAEEKAKNRRGMKLYEMIVLPNDLLFRTRNVQGRVEAVRALRANSPWNDVAQSIEKLDAELESKFHGPQRFLYLLSLISIPNYRKAVLLTVQTETKRRLVITGIALKRYQLQRGGFPEGLDGLRPAFVAAVPLDPMSGAPLRYRLNGDKSFTLYSVGEDGKDDGGDPSDVTNTALNWRPAKLGGWGGRDTVWPWPASTTQPQAITAAEQHP